MEKHVPNHQPDKVAYIYAYPPQTAKKKTEWNGSEMFVRSIKTLAKRWL